MHGLNTRPPYAIIPDGKLMNSRPVVIFAVVVAIIVGAAIYFLNQDTAPHAPPQTNSTPAPTVKQPDNSPAYTVNSSPQSPSSSQLPVVPKPGVPVPPPAAPQLTEDDIRIAKI